MKRIDRLIVGELLGPWVFGVAIFTTLIMAGTYLFKLTEYLVGGVGFGTILELTFLMLPGVMVKTFPMSVLLATLLGFGRLSSDSEIVALRAAGASLARVMVPVGVFGVIVAAMAFGINEIGVPSAAYRGVEITQTIEKTLKGGGGEPVFRAVYNPTDGKLLALIMARDFNMEKRSLRDAWLVGYDKSESPAGILYAKGMVYRGDDDWEVEGGGKLFTYDLNYVVQLDRIWPSQMPKPPKFEDIAAERFKDLDSHSMQRTAERIAIAKRNPTFSPEYIRNLEYGYHNKIALPLAAMIFGLVGAPLGIRNHRSGTAVGFSLSVLIIFLYMMLTRFMSLWALGGKIPASAASYAPLAIGLVVAAYAIHKKNV